MAAATKARQNARRRNRARRDAPRDYWRGRATPRRVGLDRWHLVADRGPGKPRLNLTPLVESFDWTDASAVLEGTMTLRLPKDRLDLTEGHVVICHHAAGLNAALREVWRMRISAPALSVRDGGLSLTLHDDLHLLGRSKDDFIYKKDKAHPHGWRPHEIVADIARRYRFRVGRIPKTKGRIKNLTRRDASPLDAVIAAMLRERQQTGRRMRLGWRRGRLVIEPLQRSKEMLLLSGHIIDAAYTQTLGEKFATALTVHATANPKKGKKQRVKRVVVSRAAIGRYGFIHAKFSASDADSAADAVRAGKRRLAKIAKPERELTVTVPGIPTLRRGAAMRVVLPDAGLRAIVFAKQVRHSVGAGSYEMEVTCAFDDPYADTQEERSKKKKCAASKRRGRKPPKGCEKATKGRARPKPKRARTRRDRGR